MPAPLERARVVEIASYITGPYAGQLLADLGAEVIKVEEPGRGDPFRSWGEGLYGPHYLAYNRGKRSLTVNLRSAEGREIMERLLRDADVLIENFRPGVTDRLGIGYERVRQMNPRLVYCSISGVGATGPYASRPVYDTVGQALSGLMSVLTDHTRPQPVGPPFADGLTGVFACYGILAALLARQSTGRGQLVEVNMLSATLGFLLEPALWFLSTGDVPGPFTRPRAAQVYAFTCVDNKALAVHLSSPPKFWEGLTAAVDWLELREDPRFTTRERRLANYTELQETLAPRFSTLPRDEWLKRLEEQDVPCAPINTFDEVFADPQVKHLGLEVAHEHPTMGTVRSVASAISLGETALPSVSAPPVLGEDTNTILEGLGYDPGDIQRLRQSGAI
jgi:crotonobetainyl-CoA:carnitine CoA-transferase CaiB-like acyl-CoA transferase